MQSKVQLIVQRLGQTAYLAALDLQHAARERVLAGGPDELLVLEHAAVVTLGRRGGVVNTERLAALETAVVRTDRGGLATWHGPGQLVIYPIVALTRRRLSVPAAIAWLGEAMAKVCRQLGVEAAAYDSERPGVYVHGRKIGSIGLHLRRGVTTHGLSLNVCNDLAGFQAIEPCGDASLTVTTLSRELGRAVALDGVAAALVDSLSGLPP